MGQKRWTEQEIADLVRLYPNKGISLAHLEQHFGRRKRTVKQQAQRLGLRRPNHTWSEQDVADLVRMYTDEDISHAQMIERFDCT